MRQIVDRAGRSAVSAPLVGAALIVAFGSLAGCSESGPELAPVRGRVLMDNEPLPNVTLEFSPEGEGSTSFGVTDEKGNYELGYTRDKKGAMVGWHTVDIYYDPDIVRSPGMQIPERYNADTALREEVVDDENVINFELRSDESDD